MGQMKPAFGFVEQFRTSLVGWIFCRWELGTTPSFGWGVETQRWEFSAIRCPTRTRSQCEARICTPCCFLEGRASERASEQANKQEANGATCQVGWCFFVLPLASFPTLPLPQMARGIVIHAARLYVIQPAPQAPMACLHTWTSTTRSGWCKMRPQSSVICFLGDIPKELVFLVTVTLS